MRTAATTLLALWASTLLAQKPASTHQVHFSSGSATITANTAEPLRAFLQAPALAYPCLKVTLAGHTDADGSDAANLALSQRRVEAVKRLLTEWGVPATNLHVAAEGESKPLADNESDAGKAQNRRVELRIVKAECDLGRQGVAFSTLSFDISKGIDFTYPRSGTQIHIAPGSLTDSQGRPASGQATLHYREWRDPADFVLSGIPMQFPHNGSGDLFHSGGMYELRVTQNGKPLSPASDKMPKVDFVQTEEADFDRFSFVGNEWRRVRQPLQGPRAANRGAGINFCDAPRTWGELNGDTLATFRQVLNECIQAASLPSVTAGDKGKGLPPVLDPDKAFINKNYLGMTYCGPKPTQAALDTLACITLATKPVAKGHVVTLMVESNSFPEAASVHRLTLVASNTDFDAFQRKGAGRKFCDFRLVHQPNSNRGTLELKDQIGTIRLSLGIFAKPKISPKGKIQVSRRDRQSVSRVMEEYRSRRQRRCRPVPTINITEHMRDWSRPILPNSELCMTTDMWILEFKKNANLMKERYTQALDRFTLSDSAALGAIRGHIARRDSLVRSGKIALHEEPRNAIGGNGTFRPFTWRPALNGPKTPIYDLGFGVHNCDQIYVMPAPVVLTPTFESGGKEVQPRFTFCLFKELNGMMLGDPPHGSNKNIYMDRKWKCSAVLVEGFNGRFYALPLDDIASLQENLNTPKPVLELIDISAQAKSPETLRKFLSGENT